MMTSKVSGSEKHLRELIDAVERLYSFVSTFSFITLDSYICSEPEPLSEDLLRELAELDGRIYALLQDARLEKPDSWHGGFGYLGLQIVDIGDDTREGSKYPRVLLAPEAWQVGMQSLITVIYHKLGEPNLWIDDASYGVNSSDSPPDDFTITGGSFYLGGKTYAIPPMQRTIFKVLLEKSPDQVLATDIIDNWTGNAKNARKSMNEHLRALRTILVSAVLNCKGIKVDRDKIIETHGSKDVLAFSFDKDLIKKFD